MGSSSLQLTLMIRSSFALVSPKSTVIPQYLSYLLCFINSTPFVSTQKTHNNRFLASHSPSLSRSPKEACTSYFSIHFASFCDCVSLSSLLTLISHNKRHHIVWFVSSTPRSFKLNLVALADGSAGHRGSTWVVILSSCDLSNQGFLIVIPLTLGGVKVPL